jgi:catechol 2,3-dioxygenase-like lactoylglutathione lyase family enzyme
MCRCFPWGTVAAREIIPFLFFPMKNRTITVTVPTDRDDVFHFLSALSNLPLWAAESFQSLTYEGGYAKASTPTGEVYVTLLADDRTGVIDLLTGSRSDEMMVCPLRVLRRPHGAAVSCTLFQAVDEPDEFYERSYATLLADFRNLAVRFGEGRLHAPTHERAAFYPGIVTARFFETWDFYATHLGFRTVCESDIYVQLAHPTGAQIAVLRHEIDGPVEELVSATDGRGVWLNLDVADADAEQRRLAAAGVEIARSAENTPWGDRQFIVRDPNGVLIAIAHDSEVRGTESRPLAVN